MKNKTVVIIGVISVILIGIALIFIFITPEKENEDNISYKDYVAEISINPVIRLSYRIRCVKDECSEPIVENIELVDEDAKAIYTDFDLAADATLKQVIEDLVSIAINNMVEFDTINIATNWNDFDDYSENIENYEKEIVITYDIEETDETFSEDETTSTTSTTKETTSRSTKSSRTSRTTKRTSRTKTTKKTTEAQDDEETTTKKEETTTSTTTKKEETTTTTTTTTTTSSVDDENQGILDGQS